MDYGRNNLTREESDIQQILETSRDISNISILIIFCFGVPANIYVLRRLRKLAKENRHRYENGAGLGLFAMTTSDLISMLFTLLQRTLDIYAPLLTNIASSADSVEALEVSACKV